MLQHPKWFRLCSWGGQLELFAPSLVWHFSHGLEVREGQFWSRRILLTVGILLFGEISITVADKHSHKHHHKPTDHSMAFPPSSLFFSLWLVVPEADPFGHGANDTKEWPMTRFSRGHDRIDQSGQTLVWYCDWPLPVGNWDDHFLAVELSRLSTTKPRGFSTPQNYILIGDSSILRQALLKCIGRGIASSFLASQACGAIGILAEIGGKWCWFDVG